MSEQILLLNPRRRRHYKTRRRSQRRRTRARRRRMPRYWATARRLARESNPRRRRRYAGRRRRHSSRRRRVHHYVSRRRASNPRRRRSHRRYRRASNPRLSVRGLTGRILMPALIGATGGVVLDVAWGYLSPKVVPASFQTGWAGLAAKLGVLYGGAWLLNRFILKGGRARVMTSRAVMGATTVLAYGALKGALQSVAPSGVPGLSGYMDYHSYALPGTRMHGYMPRTLGSLEDLYSPAAVIQPPGTPVPRQFGGYIAAQPGLSGYQPHTAGGGGLMGDWQNDGM